MRSFDFDSLFILDLANNHQGDVDHGLNIIKAVGDVVAGRGVRGALKFQFRELESFIHPDFKQASDVKHIGRFLSTALGRDDYAAMTDAVRQAGLVTMATPFDEPSVDLLLELDIEVIKVASCSATDRPLLKRIAQAHRPVILSTAAMSMSQIDRVVSYFEHHNVQFALMHCVALYPTPTGRLNLNQISLLGSRYPAAAIGWSTHEGPDDTEPVQIAFARGARLFERHVGLKTDRYDLNAYSSTPTQIDKWIGAFQRVAQACGGEQRCPASKAETQSLASLMRGVFARKPISKGKSLSRDDVFFAMPLQPGQLTTSQWVEQLVADRDYQVNGPLNDAIAQVGLPTGERLYQIILQTRGMLNDARICVGKHSSIEISHHYGLERFREFGCVLVECINRAYCKKLVVQLPRQKHPYHYHEKKEETFQLLRGDLEVETEGKRTKLQPGDTILIAPGAWHKFHTLDGAIFEEVSTTHFNNDSYYEDPAVARLPREKRKTRIDNWEEISKDAL